MNCAQTDKYRSAAILIFILCCIGAAVGLCNTGQTGAKDTPTGELKLEGQHIERLVVMRRSDGYSTTFRNPGQAIRLPAGEYQLHGVHLKGGYTRSRSAGNEQIAIRAGQQEIVRTGAPLVPTITVQRQGRILRLNYELRGVGGEAYTSGDRSRPPTFAVYRGQEKIDSGRFEFG